MAQTQDSNTLYDTGVSVRYPTPRNSGGVGVLPTTITPPANPYPQPFSSPVQYTTQVQPIVAGDPSAPAIPGATPPNLPVDPTTDVPAGNSTTPAAPVAPDPVATRAAAWLSDPQYANMDPNLRQIYQDTGMSPAGRGTGFADWQYWQGVGPSQYGRLRNDILGTGTDQPTGTPGSGAWMSSGRVASSVPGGLSPFELGSFNATANPIANPQASALFSQLMARANQSENVSPDDPTVKAATDAFRAEETRGARDAISAAAEKGGATTNLDAVSRSAYEKAGQQTADFQAQAMTNELSARRQEIAQALAGASGLLTNEQSLALQEEAKQIDAMLSKYGIDTGESEFARQLAQNAFQFDTNNYNTVYGA